MNKFIFFKNQIINNFGSNILPMTLTQEQIRLHQRCLDFHGLKLGAPLTNDQIERFSATEIDPKRSNLAVRAYMKHSGQRQVANLKEENKAKAKKQSEAQEKRRANLTQSIKSKEQTGAKLNEEEVKQKKAASTKGQYRKQIPSELPKDGELLQNYMKNLEMFVKIYDTELEAKEQLDRLWLEKTNKQRQDAIVYLRNKHFSSDKGDKTETPIVSDDKQVVQTEEEPQIVIWNEKQTKYHRSEKAEETTQETDKTNDPFYHSKPCNFMIKDCEYQPSTWQTSTSKSLIPCWHCRLELCHDEPMPSDGQLYIAREKRKQRADRNRDTVKRMRRTLYDYSDTVTNQCERHESDMHYHTFDTNCSKKLKDVSYELFLVDKEDLKQKIPCGFCRLDLLRSVEQIPE
jgi:hypothetical protein